MYKITVEVVKMKDKKKRDMSRKKLAVSLFADEDIFNDIDKDKDFDIIKLISSLFQEQIIKEWKKLYPKDFEK